MLKFPCTLENIFFYPHASKVLIFRLTVPDIYLNFCMVQKRIWDNGKISELSITNPPFDFSRSQFSDLRSQVRSRAEISVFSSVYRLEYNLCVRNMLIFNFQNLLIFHNLKSHISALISQITYFSSNLNGQA